MLFSDINAELQYLELITRKIASGSLVAHDKSRYKGTGFEFDQLREYQQGDDIRFVDFKSSARAQKMLVRQYLEDRSRTIMLIIDTSGSTYYSSSTELKAAYIRRLAALVAFAGLYAHDAVGYIGVSDTVDFYIPPRCSREHTLQSLHAIVSYGATQCRGTVLDAALHHLMSLSCKRMLVFIISDCLGSVNAALLQAAARRHECVIIRCLDTFEDAIPELGILTVQDSETGALLPMRIQGSIATNSLAAYHEKQRVAYASLGVDMFTIYTGKAYIIDFAHFLRQRLRHV